MQKLDWVFDYAASRGMNIELILFGYEVDQGEGLWADVTNQNFWIDTLVKRYRNRPNLFMYTVANEFERYPDGRYSYSAEDVEWVKAVATQIRRNDTMHPIGAHPSVWITQDDPFQKYEDFVQSRPQVVWPLWENSLLDLNITQNNEGVQPRTWGNFTPTEEGRGSWAKVWPIEDLIDRGYALATFYNGDIDPDTPDQRGLQNFFRPFDPADDCGTIGAWAWGLQRAVDYLVTAC